jgi:hypothetical protein
VVPLENVSTLPLVRANAVGALAPKQSASATMRDDGTKPELHLVTEKARIARLDDRRRSAMQVRERVRKFLVLVRRESLIQANIRLLVPVAHLPPFLVGESKHRAELRPRSVTASSVPTRIGFTSYSARRCGMASCLE